MIEGTLSINTQQQFLHELRCRTNSMHKQLEETRLSAALMQHELSMQQYAAYVVRMQPIVAAYEVMLHLAKPLFADVEERSKLAMINDDLFFLSSKTTLPERIAFAFPANQELTVILGIMYVMEGSSLGGRMILSHVQKTLGFSEQRGAKFFAGAGAQTGALWKNFLNVLTDYAISHNCESTIIDSAIATFSAIHNHFAQD